MNKVLSIETAIKTSVKIRSEGKTIVLVGGCFDILHPAHVAFLQKAKKQGDVLFVLLESDQAIRIKKGKNRPIYSQKDRAKVLGALSCVDYVLLLPFFTQDRQYDKLLFRLKPTIIATTIGDQNRHHKERQASLVGASVVDVIQRVNKASTSKVAKLLVKDYSL